MTSRGRQDREAFVWVWLPGATEPVVSGRLAADGPVLRFNYGQSYLERKEALPLYLPELPLQAGVLPLPRGLSMPCSLRDGAPDAWGRRVILNRAFAAKGAALDSLELSELTFLLESGSDRVGALDFQRSPREYVPRTSRNPELGELLEAAYRVEEGLPLSEELDQALHHGSSIGGARPKAMLEQGATKYVAKFSSSSDVYSVVKAEYVAMRLAARCGLSVAPVSLVRASGKDVLLVERFDREKVKAGWSRRLMVSGLTLLGLDEMMARYASYVHLAELVRHRFSAPRATLRELFARIVFNILTGNTDDHARNHAAFWDGEGLTLTPAYDLCPQGRVGQEASQAMLISGEDRSSRLATCFEAAHHFLLTPEEARALVEQQLRSIAQYWAESCDEARLSVVERNYFWGRQFLNPFAFMGLAGPEAELEVLGAALRRSVA